MINYIFSINKGRSRLEYLSQMLAECVGVIANHEPVPEMNGEEMYQFLKGNKKPMRALMKQKIKSIKEKKENKNIYAETHHTFIKSFGWLLPEFK